MPRRAKTLIPDDLQSILNAEDINDIFRYLETEFHLSKDWRIDFHSELLRQSRDTSDLEFFCLYLLKNIEPVLKSLLRRNDIITFAVIRYLLKDRIVGKNKYNKEAANFYVSWKKKE
jgi:hypothetical protein